MWRQFYRRSALYKTPAAAGGEQRPEAGLTGGYTIYYIEDNLKFPNKVQVWC